MFNEFNKKEHPILGLLGMGGGIARAGGGPSVFETSGGTQITSGSDVYHVFLYTGSPQSFTVTGAPGSLTAKLLVIGGGGSGGFSADGVSGGGGAGGVQYYTSYPITDGTTTVVVGNSGANPGSGPTITPNPAINDGENTTFGSAVGYGGGGGAHEFPGIRAESGHNGGSAGGGSGYQPPGQSGGSATQPGAPLVGGAGGTNYGSNGGDGGNSGPPNENGGGGGGAGGAGGDSSGGNPGSRGGPAGNGRAFPEFPGPVLSPAIPSTNVSTIGPTGLFAGGGAGGFNGTPLIPGSPGGGSGTRPYQNPPTFANPATGYGSGGGGGQYGAANSTGMPKGSPGIVIVKYST